MCAGHVNRVPYLVVDHPSDGENGETGRNRYIVNNWYLVLNLPPAVAFTTRPPNPGPGMEDDSSGGT